MDKQKSIEALQFFVTGLSEGAFVHNWSQGTLELIEKIGAQNWLKKQF